MIFFAVDKVEGAAFPFTTVSFIIGASTSMLAGFIGMRITTITNVKTTYLCNGSAADEFNHENALSAGFKAAFQGGQVLGFVLVGLALLILEVIILTYKGYVIVPSDTDY